MKVIGLTGNIGCGKSTVAGMLRRLGVATIDADDVAREIRETDPGVRGAILERFGTLDPPTLAGIVFNDAARLAELETLIHPAVRAAVTERLAELEAAGVRAVAIEAIKLLESPLRERCEVIWVVACDKNEALERVAHARRLSADDARARLAHQSPQAQKVAAADVVIDGSAPLDVTRRQVEEALARLST